MTGSVKTDDGPYTGTGAKRRGGKEVAMCVVNETETGRTDAMGCSATGGGSNGTVDAGRSKELARKWWLGEGAGLWS
jgi:hypothetical protein